MPEPILMAYDYRQVDLDILQLMFNAPENQPVTLVYGKNRRGDIFAMADTYCWNRDKVNHQPLPNEQAINLWFSITSPKRTITPALEF